MGFFDPTSLYVSTQTTFLLVTVNETIPLKGLPSLAIEEVVRVPTNNFI